MSHTIAPWPVPPRAAADWDEIVRYADGVDGYRRAGSFQSCMAIAQAVTDGFRQTGELPRDAGALALSVFVEVRRYRMVGSPDGTGMAYLRSLLTALNDLTESRAA